MRTAAESDFKELGRSCGGGGFASPNRGAADGGGAFNESLPRAGVTLILLAWCLAQYPDHVTPDVTDDDSHGPEITLRLLVQALGTGAIVLLPSLVFLFHLFKGKETR